MKRLLCALALTLLPAALSAAEWKEAKGTHFIVCYDPSAVNPPGSGYSGDISRFVSDLLDRAERCYTRIASDLGYARASGFWTWDKRVRIRIYPGHAEYVASSGHPEWSHGMADYGKKEISSYAFSPRFLESILPHELAHLIFRDFVGFRGEVPRWLDEGVAQWEEESGRERVKSMVRALSARGILLSLADMMKLNISSVGKTDSVSVRSFTDGKGVRLKLSLRGEELVATYYLQSASLVGFLIERYGSEDFARFCRELRDGKQFEEALAAVYPPSLRTLEDFEKEWNAYIRRIQ